MSFIEGAGARAGAGVFIFGGGGTITAGAGATAGGGVDENPAGRFGRSSESVPLVPFKKSAIEDIDGAGGRFVDVCALAGVELGD